MLGMSKSRAELPGTRPTADGGRDAKVKRTKRHKLLDIVAIATCASMCGADSWVHTEMFGKRKEQWFRNFLELPYGIPTHDAFEQVFSRLDPEQFQSGFAVLWSGPSRWPRLTKGKWWP